MALTYNNVDPTTINYKGTDITVVKYGTTAVWGKHYTLSISAGSNTSITVNRTSSPNQHASTGNLSNGATIYYGDTLTISYSVSSGYNISTHTVNGTTFTSGNQFTVTSNISVITSAVASASWHTVWSGNSTKSITNFSSWQSFRFNFPTTINSSRTTRITVSSYDYEGSMIVNNKTLQLPGTFGDIKVNSFTSTYMQCQYTSSDFDEYSTDSIKYTKIEQYY